MNKLAPRLIMSFALIALGVVILLSNLKIITYEMQVWQWLLVGLFALGGLAFLLVFGDNSHDHWWAIIPGFTLFGLAAMIASADVLEGLSAAIFMGMIGLSFLVIYWKRREFWWALIPGGVMVSLAAVIATANVGEGMVSGSMLFLGLGLTFLVIYLLPTAQGRMTWAIWPAGVLGAMGFMLLVGFGEAAKYVWPVALMLAGGWLVLHSLRQRQM